MHGFLVRYQRVRAVARVAAAVVLSGLLAGCAGHRMMMPAPTLYGPPGTVPPFAGVPPELRRPEVDVLYVTDRVPARDDAGRLDYGIGRSPSVAFGSAVVRIGDDVSWEELGSVARGNPQPLELSLISVEEQARAPETPLPWTLVNGRPVTEPEAQANIDEVEQALCAEMAKRLALTERKEAFVYIHGVANTFADSVFAIAELWHYMGREGVPVVFSWPAGRGGLVRGYTYDRESGEFAIFHVKQFLYALSRCPQVRHISILAHSRGTDVTLTALRELTIAVRATGRDPIDTLRLRNVVLAAPDLDLGVTMQRVASERLSASVRRLTIYTSPRDKAISIAEFLFGGLVRIGQLNFLLLDREVVGTQRRGGGVLGNVAFVQYEGSRGGAHGHSYFRENPAVSSDLLLVLRYDRDPGAEHGRPLRQIEGVFWAIDDGYLEDTRARH